MRIDELLRIYEELGPLERKVLMTLVYRLYAGQRKYGKLEEGKKVWTWEAAEEAIDMAVYLSTSLVAVTEDTKRRYLADLGESEVRADLTGNEPTINGDWKEVEPGGAVYSPIQDENVEEPECGAV
jgi:hypothetical protein